MQAHCQCVNIELINLTSVTINEDVTFLIIKNLNAKAHEWNNISISMIQLCEKAIALSLKLLFRSVLKEDFFPDGREKSTVVPWC